MERLPAAVRALSFHAAYRCRHSGACCTAGWPIPVEADLHGRLARAAAAGQLRPGAAERPPARGLFEAPPGAPAATPVLLRTDSTGACICYERGAKRCAIHRRLGRDHLPSACRHFPRIALNDRRGCHVTLSHFCPTAAGLLFSAPAGAGDAVLAGPGLALPGTIDGLDARDALPPLLRPDLLMDWDAWDAWERGAVRLLLTRGTTPDAALALVAGAAEHVRGWRPGHGALSARVEVALTLEERTPGPHRTELTRLEQLARRSVPTELGRPEPAVGRDCPPDVLDVPELALPIRRYLAAHAHANWIAYHGRGLRSWVRAIVTARAVLATAASRARTGGRLTASELMDAVRESDRLLRHLVAPERLAGYLSRHEDEPVRLAPAPGS